MIAFNDTLDSVDFMVDLMVKLMVNLISGLDCKLDDGHNGALDRWT